MACFSLPSTVTTFSEATFDFSALSIPSNHSAKAAFVSADTASIFSFMRRAIRSRNLRTPVAIPKPYSALSSNNELAQAGPLPSLFIV